MIKLRSIIGSARLISRAIKTMNMEPQDIIEVLLLVNTYTNNRFGIDYCKAVNKNNDPRFEIIDRGYDVSLTFPPGYPTIFIKYLPSGETFKVGIDERIDAILDEWSPTTS